MPRKKQTRAKRRTVAKSARSTSDTDLPSSAAPCSHINYLPVEILLAVFRLSEGVQFGGVSNLAYVCRRWMEVLAMEPRFWSTLRVRLDDPASFIPSLIRTFFIATRDNWISVEIYVEDRVSPSLSVAEEHSRIREVMECAQPHFPRIEELMIRTAYRSSVVVVSQYLNNAPLRNLCWLELDSWNVDSTAPLLITSLDISELNVLKVDARSFVGLGRANIQWPPTGMTREEDGSIVQLHLYIIRYRPTEDSNLMSAVDLLISLSLLNKNVTMELEIVDVAFDPQSFTWCPCVDTPLYFESVEFVDIDAPFIAALFRCISERPENVTLKRCEIPPENSVRGRHAYLEGIASSSSMVNVLKTWSGRELRIKDCPGFDDAVLQSMADDGLACFRRLRSLSITGCAFTTAAFQCMVERRYPVGPSAAQQRWAIRVDNGPKLTRELRSWFKARVHSFSWES